jgi:uncharacterized membrane protein YdbT with pleckstrin-like domain
MAFPRRLLTDGEHIVLDLRPHWVTLLGPVLWTIVLVAAAIGGSIGLQHTSISDKSTATLIVAGVAIVAWLILAFPRILRWLTTQFALTNERLIARSGVVAKRSKEIPLEAINDITFTQSFWGRLIKEGTLVVESAGERGQESFRNVRNPEAVQKSIYHESEARKGLGGRPGVPTGSVADEIAKLAALRDAGSLSAEEFEAQKAKLLGS